MIIIDNDLLEAARWGDRAALEKVVREIERPVFNLAMRMLAHRADAEDATQEILVQIATHLSAIEDPAAAGAWAMKVACRHLVKQRRKSRVEQMRLTFAGFGGDLATGQADIELGELTEAEQNIAMQEVKIGCTLAMLTCLTRSNRIAYILGDVLEIPDASASIIMEITPVAYRQRLSRSRRLVTEFLRRNCGIVSAQAPCCCERRVVPAIACGRISVGYRELSSVDQDDSGLTSEVRRLEAMRSTAVLMRSNPDFVPSKETKAWEWLGLNSARESGHQEIRVRINSDNEA